MAVIDFSPYNCRQYCNKWAHIFDSFKKVGSQEHLNLSADARYVLIFLYKRYEPWYEHFAVFKIETLRYIAKIPVFAMRAHIPSLKISSDWNAISYNFWVSIMWLSYHTSATTRKPKKCAHIENRAAHIVGDLPKAIYACHARKLWIFQCGTNQKVSRRYCQRFSQSVVFVRIAARLHTLNLGNDNRLKKWMCCRDVLTFLSGDILVLVSLASDELKLKMVLCVCSHVYD